MRKLHTATLKWHPNWQCSFSSCQVLERAISFQQKGFKRLSEQTKENFLKKKKHKKQRGKKNKQTNKQNRKENKYQQIRAYKQVSRNKLTKTACIYNAILIIHWLDEAPYFHKRWRWT